MPQLYSWNVNGVRAAVRKGLLEWLESVRPDVLCLQEVKAHPDDVPEAVLRPKGYDSVWQPAGRKGYSGVATWFKRRKPPLDVAAMDVAEFDAEGRLQALDYGEYVVLNTYWPNSQPERARLDYKLRFVKALRRFAGRYVKQGKHVVICGDFNIAHRDIDLARPKQNRDNPGFYPEECAALDRFLKAGYLDTFRHFTPDPGHYTWWSYRANARAKNIGWRLDYHMVNREMADRLKKADILPEIMGSDHCPVRLTIR